MPSEIPSKTKKRLLRCTREHCVRCDLFLRFAARDTCYNRLIYFVYFK